MFRYEVKMRMKKRILKIAVLLIVVWWLVFGRIELLTALHSHEFEGEYRQTHMIGGHPKPKVMQYSSDTAKVYYVDKNGGDVLYFEKKKGKWEMTSWDTVWARGGSADGFIWPYIFDNWRYTHKF